MTTMMISLDDLRSHPDLDVVERNSNNNSSNNDNEANEANEALFVAALTGPAFVAQQGSLLMATTATTRNCYWPTLICTARSVAAVQAVVRYANTNDCRLRVRTGGHCWHASWLSDNNSKTTARTILLDMAALNDCTWNKSQQGVEAGPGTVGLDVLNMAMAQNRFFPCGHYADVRIGGFILGGGYGIGFTRYGMTSMLVQAVDVVLADGSLLHACETNDSASPQERAVMKLMRGSHAYFPAIVTKFYFSNLPPLPQGLATGALIFDLKDFHKALTAAFDIQFRGDYDKGLFRVETTLVFKASWPELLQTSRGCQNVAILSLAIWADTHQEAQFLWDECTGVYKNDSSLLVPRDDKPQATTPDSIPKALSKPYPSKNQYHVQAHSATPEIYQWTDDEISDLIQPIVDMYEGGDLSLSALPPPPPPSHTLIVPLHPAMQTKTHHGKPCATGFTPAMKVMSYAILDEDAKASTEYQKMVQLAHARLESSPVVYTQIPEGNMLASDTVDGRPDAFTPEAWAQFQQAQAMFDPKGVFAKPRRVM